MRCDVYGSFQFVKLFLCAILVINSIILLQLVVYIVDGVLF
jgi:hypothetical protein